MVKLNINVPEAMSKLMGVANSNLHYNWSQLLSAGENSVYVAVADRRVTSFSALSQWSPRR